MSPGPRISQFLGQFQQKVWIFVALEMWSNDGLCFTYARPLKSSSFKPRPALSLQEIVSILAHPLKSNILSRLCPKVTSKWQSVGTWKLASQVSAYFQLAVFFMSNYCVVQSKWEFFIKMRAALLASILPRVMKKGESKEGSSYFDSTLLTVHYSCKVYPYFQLWLYVI